MKLKQNVKRMSEKVIFVLSDKLPTYYEAVIVINKVATQPKSNKMYVRSILLNVN